MKILMGKVLKTMGLIPELILCSPAKRAYLTAQYLAQECSYPEKSIKLVNCRRAGSNRRTH